MAGGWNGFMKTLVAALFTALLVFALATGWMELVQPQLDAVIAANAKATEVPTKPATKRSTKRTVKVDTDADAESDDELDIEVDSKIAKSSRSSKSSRESQASKAARDRLILQLADVKQQESKLVAREEMLRMLYDDIRSELTAVEEIRRQSATELAMAERRVHEAANVRKPTESASNEPVERPASSVSTRQSSEARIAQVVQDLSEQGNVTAAASLLSGMKDREIAKVLTALSTRDPRLALQLSDRLQASKETLRR